MALQDMMMLQFICVSCEVKHVVRCLYISAGSAEPALCMCTTLYVPPEAEKELTLSARQASKRARWCAGAGRLGVLRHQALHPGLHRLHAARPGGHRRARQRHQPRRCQHRVQHRALQGARWLPMRVMSRGVFLDAPAYSNGTHIVQLQDLPMLVSGICIGNHHGCHQRTLQAPVCVKLSLSLKCRG